MQQQVGGLEGQREAQDAPAEVIRVPQEVVGGVHKDVLEEERGAFMNQDPDWRLTGTILSTANASDRFACRLLLVLTRLLSAGLW